MDAYPYPSPRGRQFQDLSIHTHALNPILYKRMTENFTCVGVIVSPILISPAPFVGVPPRLKMLPSSTVCQGKGLDVKLTGGERGREKIEGHIHIHIHAHIHAHAYTNKQKWT